MGYSTYFYKIAGLPTGQAFNLSLAQYALGFFGTIGSWGLMGHLGRRTIYTGGLLLLLLFLFDIGRAGFAPPNATNIQARATGGAAGGVCGTEVGVNTGASWAVGSLSLICTLIYDISVGPVCYAIVAEVSSTRLRPKTVVLAGMLYNICVILNNVYTPLMLNPVTWNWGAKSGLFWAVICFICIVWCTSDYQKPNDARTIELTIFFEHRVSTRKFKSTKVESFRSESIVVMQGNITEDVMPKGILH